MDPNANLILIGMKSSGKTTIGRLVAQRLGRRFTDVDAEIERLYAAQTGEKLGFREIFKRHGKTYFRQLETGALQALAAASQGEGLVLATGGGLPLADENRPLLKQLGTIVFLDVDEAVLLPRIIHGGIPAFFPYPDDPARSLAELLAARRPIYRALAHFTVGCGPEAPEANAEKIIQQLETQTHED
jgi:shikimate kinase